MKRYMKKVLLLLTMVLLLVPGFAVSAKNSQKVIDLADILTAEEEGLLQEQFLSMAEACQCDIVVLTTDSCGGKSPQDYTDDYYYENGYGYGDSLNGIMLMVSMGDRKFHLATRGAAIDLFGDWGLELIDEEITPYLSDGSYYEAFSWFGHLAESFLETDEDEDYEAVYDEYAYDYDQRYASSGKSEMDMQTRVLISLGAAFVIALIAGLILFAQLKSVGIERRAQEYVRPGSFQVTRARDVFLYRTVQKVRKPKNEGGGGGGTHRTSGGGRTGSF